MPLDLTSFAVKWQQTQLTEKSAYQQHFRDLCEALGVPHPTEEDIVGTNYTFEKHVTKVGGGSGFADVWRRDTFAWEYKLPGGDLNRAYKQLNEYHEDLGNPPLLIVCDFKRFEVHTKFDSQRSRVYKFDLEELRRNQSIPTSAVLPQDVLRYVFGDRNKLRPEAVTERVTRDAATDLLKLAQQLELERAASPLKHTKEQIAHFLIRIVFCLFADSIGLIPNNVFRKLVEASRQSRVMFNKQLPQLFEAMSNEGSYFGADIIPWFNGGLFNGTDTIELNTADCDILRKAAKRDWSQIEPSIFGTLFERSLNAAKRSMIGAHYTSPEDILLLIEPVIMTPLRRAWTAMQMDIEEALALEEGQLQRRNLRANRPAAKLLIEWAEKLSKIRILDPACGSGNFLYIAMKQLLDLWDEARTFGLERGLILPVESMPTPAQLYGIELDFYAHEIASAVVWIGLLQWKRDHSYNDQPKPILHKLANIEHENAILRYDASAISEEWPKGQPSEPKWKEVEYIVGNPPFLGGNRVRQKLGDDDMNAIQYLYRGRVPAGADLVTYWFERARTEIELQPNTRAGLIATQSIRGGVNRRVLDRINETGDIFLGWSDREWMLDGALVHVSIVAFDSGTASEKFLNGTQVKRINADLTSLLDVTKAARLPENRNLCLRALEKGGPFDISDDVAQRLIRLPVNVNGRNNADVLRRFLNATDITERDRKMWLIDFFGMTGVEAAQYEGPFQLLKKRIEDERLAAEKPEDATKPRDHWWLHRRNGADLRAAVSGLNRFIVTIGHGKHRIFSWLPSGNLPSNALYAFARSDDYFFGVLSSSIHELWTRAQGTQVREMESGFRYTPTSTFETFPFPYVPGTEPTEEGSSIVRAIADASRELVSLRDAWLNPPNASDDELKTRTLTRLYNAHPEWLNNAHRTLDKAVFTAYGWQSTLSGQEILAYLLALNHARSALKLRKQAKSHV